MSDRIHDFHLKRSGGGRCTTGSKLRHLRGRVFVVEKSLDALGGVNIGGVTVSRKGGMQIQDSDTWP